MSDAAKSIALFARFAGPIIALGPDLERLGDLDAVIAERTRRATELKADISDSEAKLERLRAFAAGTAKDSAAAAAEHTKSIDAHKAELARLQKDADAAAARTCDEAERSAEAAIDGAHKAAGDIKAAALAELNDISDEIVASRHTLYDIEDQVAAAKKRLEEIKAAAKAFAGG